MLDDISLHDEIDADVTYFNQVYPSFLEDRTNQYYDSNSYNNLKSPYNDTKFSSKYQKKIRTYGNALICYFSNLNQKFDIICLTETWMIDLESVNDILQDYNQ